MSNILKKTITVVLCCNLLSSCYFPVRFDAEVVVDNRGFYEMYFAGYMTDTTLYKDLKTGEISGLEQRNRVSAVEADLKRDSATKTFQYIRDGIFELNWEKSGDLLDVGNVTFIRRNQDILTLKYVSTTGLITMLGKSISKQNRQRLLEAGLNTEGEIRFVTNLKIVNSNATGSRPHKPRPGFTEYFWTIRSINDPTPTITASFQ